MATMCREATKTATNLMIGVAFCCVATTVSAAPFAECVRKAATRYSVSEELVHGIIQVESGGRSEAMNMGHQQRTRSYDIGLMQINSGHLRTLSRHGIKEADLFDPCTNIRVGAWLLADSFSRRGTTWDAVGAYNAACSQLKGQDCIEARAQYAWRVYRQLPAQRNAPLGKHLVATATTIPALMSVRISP